MFQIFVIDYPRLAFEIIIKKRFLFLRDYKIF